jgi:hypothetical protein
MPLRPYYECDGVSLYLLATLSRSRSSIPPFFRLGEPFCPTTPTIPLHPSFEGAAVVNQVASGPPACLLSGRSIPNSRILKYGRGFLCDVVTINDANHAGRERACC